jgi:RNA polymerase sigma-70 factor (ECF subfamily)
VIQDETSVGMLAGAVAGDPVDWNRFAEHCQRVIASWCRSRNLSEADRDDVVQESLLIVLMKIHQFRRVGRGSLRAWLRAIAWRCRCEAVLRSDSVLQLQESHQQFAAASDQISELEEEFERLRRLELLEECLASVRQRLQPTTWLAFQQLALQNIPGAQVAQQVGITLEAVYAARRRVVLQLRREWRRRAAGKGFPIPAVLHQHDDEADDSGPAASV